MMRDRSFNRAINADAPVSAPHFDDEQTLLTARRVVPLEKIEAKVTRRRRWFLGGAFATAMLLGAASALLASYLRLRNTETPASALSQVEITPSPVPTPEVVITETVAILEEGEDPEETELSVAPVTPKKESATRRRSVSRPESDFLRDKPRLSEEDELERIRATILYDEWQERRLRRANRRERRRAERPSRDLSNLDEIFEGPRRP